MILASSCLKARRQGDSCPPPALCRRPKKLRPEVLLRPRGPPVHEIVVDGFESFEFSQYFQTHHHVAIEKDMYEVLAVVLEGVEKATVYSDEHQAYRKSIKRLQKEIVHKTTPGKQHRDKNNSLWEVNLLDLLIRHCSANHKREAIAWSKRRQASCERLVILLVWRNYMKGRREKVRGSPTPAMERGMMSAPLTIDELFEERIFRTRCELPSRWAEYYDRMVDTRAIKNPRRHELKLAY